MRVIVTGGSGFIGARLVAALAAQGQQVCVVDPAPCPAAGIDLRRQSVLDAAAMRNVVRDADAVIHLAGPLRDTLRRDPAWGATLQQQGTLNVLEACRGNAIPRFVLASSFYVYQSLPPDALVDEETPLDPRRLELFGAAKLAAEALCREYTRQYALAHAILRLGSAYGPGGSNVIGAFIDRGLRGEVFEVWGAGTRRAQYTCVQDLVQGIIAALARGNGTYNLCSPELTTTGDLAAVMEREFGFRAHFDPERPEEASFPVVSSAKATAQLGWNPRSLRDGLRQAVWEARAARAGTPAPPTGARES